MLVGIRHQAMRRFTLEMLSASPSWTVAQPRAGEMLAGAIERESPSAVVVDDGDFPECCEAALGSLPPGRVVVIGPEPDEGYRRAAMSRGAGSWVARDCVGDHLVPTLRRVLGLPTS